MDEGEQTAPQNQAGLLRPAPLSRVGEHNRATPLGQLPCPQHLPGQLRPGSEPPISLRTAYPCSISPLGTQNLEMAEMAEIEKEGGRAWRRADLQWRQGPQCFNLQRVRQWWALSALPRTPCLVSGD